MKKANFISCRHKSLEEEDISMRVIYESITFGMRALYGPKQKEIIVY